ncbi:hypothetical protein JCM10207_002109 [Rhodosporidiobolus poonsookiae]
MLSSSPLVLIYSGSLFPSSPSHPRSATAITAVDSGEIVFLAEPSSSLSDSSDELRVVLRDKDGTQLGVVTLDEIRVGEGDKGSKLRFRHAHCFSSKRLFKLGDEGGIEAYSKVDKRTGERKLLQHRTKTLLASVSTVTSERAAEEVTLTRLTLHPALFSLSDPVLHIAFSSSPASSSASSASSRSLPSSPSSQNATRATSPSACSYSSHPTGPAAEADSPRSPTWAEKGKGKAVEPAPDFPKLSECAPVVRAVLVLVQLEMRAAEKAARVQEREKEEREHEWDAW